jgi:capsular exopolysaccharide synthesis family protein
VTSASPGEGKTSVTSNLAVSFAEINHRVLVIDADLRRPRLHEVFDVSNRWGLTSLLQRRDSVHNCPFESIACETTVPGLYVLPSGPAMPSVTNLLYSRRTTELFERVRREFDTVLIDTPPVIDVADARVLATLSDGVILVIRSGSTTRDAAGESADRILHDGARLLGAVLNFWDPKQKYCSRTRSYSYPNRDPVTPADSGRAAAAAGSST